MAAAEATLRAAQEAGFDTEGATTEAVAAVARQMDAAAASASAQRTAADERQAELVAKLLSAGDEIVTAQHVGREAATRAVRAEATVKALREQLADVAEEAGECRRKFDEERDRAEAAATDAGEARRGCEAATAAREGLEWQLQVAKEIETRLSTDLSHANKAVAHMREALDDAKASGFDSGGSNSSLSLDSGRQLSRAQPISGLSVDSGHQLSAFQPISDGGGGNGVLGGDGAPGERHGTKRPPPVTTRGLDIDDEVAALLKTAAVYAGGANSSVASTSALGASSMRNDGTVAGSIGRGGFTIDSLLQVGFRV